MPVKETLLRSSQFVVEDNVCRHPREGCGVLHGDVPAHFVFARRGAFLERVGAKTYLARPGNAILLRANVDFRVSHPAEVGHDCCINLEVAPGLLEELCLSGSTCREFRYDLGFQQTYLELLAGLRNGHADTLEAEEAILELLACLLRLQPQPLYDDRRAPRAARLSRCIERVQEEILAHVDQNLGIDALARVAHCSPFHLCRIFRRGTGQSLRQYRLQQRLSNALGRLGEGEEDLAALACDLGFNSHSHMTEAFRQALAVSPRALREDLQHSDLSRVKARLQAWPEPGHA